jgi:hypothetical protein
MNFYHKFAFLITTSIASLTSIQVNSVFAASFNFDFILQPIFGLPSGKVVGQGNLSFDDDSLVGSSQEVKTLSSLKGANFKFAFQPDAIGSNFQNAGTITEIDAITNIDEPVEFLFENRILKDISLIARKTKFVDTNRILSVIQSGKYAPPSTINNQPIEYDFTTFTVITDREDFTTLVVGPSGMAIGDFVIKKVDSGIRPVNEANNIIGYSIGFGLSILFLRKNNYLKINSKLLQ